ncbi:MAG: 2-oxo acid dehydrogenase subunit E2 [Desulfobacteraceae bacterium]|nr:2-oxo acid dehydrogenase subunit E2 [Desulfobacteraceae bacterium]
MPREFKLPDLGEGIHEGEIVEVLVSVGDRVEDGQTILIVETDKATTEVPAPVDGTVKEIRVKPGQVVKVGDVLMTFLEEGEAGRAVPAAEEEKPARKPEGKPAEAPVPTATPGGPVPAAPSTRRLARELGVDLRQVTPSGPGGRVTAEDVQVFSRKTEQAAGEPPPVPAQPFPEPMKAPPLPDFSRWGAVERVPLRSIRRATARHMALSWSQIPHVFHQDVVDVTELEAFRGKHKAEIEKRGGSLSMTVFALKAAVAALKAYPSFNSSLDSESGEVILKRYYHIGVAVDTERGLIVPVIRDVDRKSITELAVELRELAGRVRGGKVDQEDLAGGSFTITNIGPLGGTGFAPIVNYPQAAILGMARARLQPVVRGSAGSFEIVPRLMLPLVLGFDHRVVDGADAARFVGTIIEELQSPEKLLLTI